MRYWYVCMRLGDRWEGEAGVRSTVVEFNLIAVVVTSLRITERTLGRMIEGNDRFPQF